MCFLKLFSAVIVILFEHFLLLQLKLSLSHHICFALSFSPPFIPRTTFLCGLFSSSFIFFCLPFLFLFFFLSLLLFFFFIFSDSRNHFLRIQGRNKFNGRMKRKQQCQQTQLIVKRQFFFGSPEKIRK